MRAARVLSIDFDYFLCVTPKACVAHFPDGIDLPSSVTVSTWATHYVSEQSSAYLKGIRFDKDALSAILRALISSEQSAYAPVMVANSHRYIVPFLQSQGIGRGADIVNFDFHHDCYDNDEIDCGSWAGHYLLRQQANVLWVKRHYSDMETLPSAARSHLQITTSVADALKKPFDCIFICRSDSWFPPHLDGQLTEFVHLLQLKFSQIQAEHGIMESRMPAVRSLMRELNKYYGKRCV